MLSGAKELRSLLYVRSPSARETEYLRLARDYGTGFANAVRDAIESHHLLEENERAAQWRGGNGAD